MDKIRDLLTKLGSEDLANEILEAIDQRQKNQEKQLNEQLKQKVLKARNLCIEEVNKYKKNLSRRVEIFLESKASQVEREARNRQAIEESKAANDLNRVKAIVEGRNIGEQSADLQAVKSENETLRRKIVTVTEDKAKIIEHYGRARGIAKKAIARNVQLESKARETAEMLAESKGKTTKGGTKLNKEQKKPKKPQTHRATIAESQSRASGAPAKKPVNADSEVMRIAGEIDSDL
jgi:hypothetical protein